MLSLNNWKLYAMSKRDSHLILRVVQVIEYLWGASLLFLWWLTVLLETVAERYILR